MDRRRLNPCLTVAWIELQLGVLAERREHGIAFDPVLSKLASRGSHKLQNGAEPIMRKPGGWLSQCLEDDEDEDDDADTGVEHNPRGFDPEEDFGAEERGEPGSWPEGAQGGGQHYGDDDGEDDGLRERRPHRDRIRSTSCTVRQSHYAGAPQRYWVNDVRGIRIGQAADILS